MTKKFLDATGLSHLWQKITDQLSTKATTNEVSNLSNKIGTVPEGKNIVTMISDAQAAATYDDTVIQSKVDTLVNTDTGKSVRKIANEELAAQLIAENADESLDTLKEIADWIQAHPEDAAAMNSAIEAINSAAAKKIKINATAPEIAPVNGVVTLGLGSAATTDTSAYDPAGKAAEEVNKIVGTESNTSADLTLYGIKALANNAITGANNASGKADSIYAAITELTDSEIDVAIGKANT